MELPLEVGAVCVTVNARHPINNRLTVLILRIDPTVKSKLGAQAPYLIRQIDGSPFPSSNDIESGHPRFYRAREVWCEGHKLRRIDLGDDMPAPAARARRKGRTPVTS